MSARTGGRAGVAALVAAAAAVAVPMLVAHPGPALAATAPAIVATPAPCAPHTGACSAEPTSLGVTFPTGVPSGVDAVDVGWRTTGRPSGAPAPAATDAVLTTASGSCTTAAGQAATTCSWPWPTGLEVAGSPVVLNGVYQVTPCSTSSTASNAPISIAPTSSTTAGTKVATSAAATTTTCTPATSPPATTFGVSVAPNAPASMSVRAPTSSAGAPVTVSWALGTAPDLAGYALTRDGTALYTCTLHGATSAGAGPCGSSPSFTDRASGSGTLGYQVVAYRYGVTGGFSGAVASPPTAAKVTLQAGSSTPLTPGPALGTPAAPVITVPVAPPSASRPAATTPTTANTYGQLPFNQAPPTTAQASAAPLEDGPRASSTSGVGGPALVAAGLLVLALAGHLLYLRGAVGRYQAAHAGTAVGPAPRPVRRRARRRVQWGSWPPLAPAEHRHR